MDKCNRLETSRSQKMNTWACRRQNLSDSMSLSEPCLIRSATNRIAVLLNKQENRKMNAKGRRLAYSTLLLIMQGSGLLILQWIHVHAFLQLNMWFSMQIVPLSGPRNYKRLWLYRRQAEAEYVLALSTSMRDVIYFMNLINEMKNFGINLPPVPKPNTTCRIF